MEGSKAIKRKITSSIHELSRILDSSEVNFLLKKIIF